jgi:hypothetical protein
MISIAFQNYPFRYQNKENGKYIYDIIRKKYVLITPEEWVRQNLLHYLIQQQGYPKGLISVEKEIRVNQLRKRYDIVVFDKERMPWMLIECKKPEVPITEKTLSQLMRYHQVLQCSYWMLSNGIKTLCGKVEGGSAAWLSSLPLYDL